MKNWLKLIICVIGAELIGILGSVFTASSVSTWYAALAKPSFNPPSWLFGPVWTILYLMIGVSLYLFMTSKGKHETKIKGYRIFGVQLALNFIWSPVFFGMQQTLWAFAIIALLWLAIILNFLRFYEVSKKAAWLLVPYWIWVSFASILNFSIWWLNK